MGGDFREVTCLIDVYGYDKDGNEVCYKRNMGQKRMIDVSKCIASESVGPRGDIHKTRCVIYDGVRGETYTIKMPYSEFKELQKEATKKETIGYIK